MIQYYAPDRKSPWSHGAYVLDLGETDKQPKKKKKSEENKTICLRPSACRSTQEINKVKWWWEGTGIGNSYYSWTDQVAFWKGVTWGEASVMRRQLFEEPLGKVVQAEERRSSNSLWQEKTLWFEELKGGWCGWRV